MKFVGNKPLDWRASCRWTNTVFASHLAGGAGLLFAF